MTAAGNGDAYVRSDGDPSPQQVRPGERDEASRERNANELSHSASAGQSRRPPKSLFRADTGRGFLSFPLPLAVARHNMTKSNYPIRGDQFSPEARARFRLGVSLSVPWSSFD